MFDWFTLIAQIVNFLILIGLLKYFLYDRILSAMDRREESIAERWDEAKDAKERAEEEIQKYRSQQEELDRRREHFLADAREDAETERKRLVEEARHEVDLERERWRESLREQREGFLRDLRNRAAHEIVRATRHLLSEFADRQLEAEVVERFLQKLADIDAETRQQMSQAIEAGTGEVKVRTAFALDDADRQQLATRLEETFDQPLNLQFQQTDDLVCGISLMVHGQKLSWEIGDYLDGLEDSIEHSIRAELPEEHASSIASVFTPTEDKEDF